MECSRATHRSCITGHVAVARLVEPSQIRAALAERHGRPHAELPGKWARYRRELERMCADGPAHFEQVRAEIAAIYGGDGRSQDVR